MATIDQNPEHLNALAKEVSRVSGLDVTCTRDCEVLGDEFDVEEEIEATQTGGLIEMQQPEPTPPAAEEATMPEAEPEAEDELAG